MSVNADTAAYTEEECRQAAEWFLIIRDAQEPSLETLQEWNRWLNAADSHRIAFEAVAQAYHLTVPSLAAPIVAPRSDAKALGSARDDAYDGSISVAEWLEQASARPRAKWPLALAAGVVVAIGVAATLIYRHDEGVTVAHSGTFVTRTGEHKALLLEDGSRVTLGARSELRVDFNDGVRRIRLEGGEAFFDVRKDPNRPFVVQALNGVITAIGTAFSVRTTQDRVTVAVTEGVVRVADGVAQRVTAGDMRKVAGHQGLNLTLGEQISFTVQDGLAAANAPVTRFAPDDAARWREGWLIYRNEPLRYVIADVARYSELKIDIADSVGEELRFTGAVFKDDVDEWVMALPKVFPLAINADETGLLIGGRVMSGR